MNYIFRFDKLVRDKIPEMLQKEGNKTKYTTLRSENLISALKDKLKEEALELSHAQSKEEIIEEIADIHEILEALYKTLSINESELAEIKHKKQMINGGFKEGVYLTTLEAPVESKTAQRLLKTPLKYPIVEAWES